MTSLSTGTCKTCKFFDREATAQASGLCKESSPQVTVVMMPQTNALTQEMFMNPMPVGAWPTVGDDLWCGRWAGKWNPLQS